MKDFSILPKGFSFKNDSGSKKLRASLVLRVFLASLLFLVIPLLFHSLVNYKHRYQEEVKDILVSLDLLSEGRIHCMQKIIDAEKELLDVFAFSLPWEEDREILLQKWRTLWPQKETSFSEIHYLVLDGKQWHCVFSSDRSLEGGYFLTDDFLNRSFQLNQFAFLGKSFLAKKNQFVITKTIRQENEPKGLLLATFPASYFMESLQATVHHSYLLDLSFLNKEGEIVASSSSLLEGTINKKQVSFHQVKGIEQGYILETKEEDFLTIKKDVPLLEGSLFVSINEDLFSDLKAKRYWSEVFLLLLSFTLIGGTVAFLFAWRMGRPLRTLYTTMEKVAAGDTKSRFIADSMGFEINVLGKTFNHMIDALLEHRQKAEEERLQKEILQNELKIGKEIQENLIVANLPHFEELSVATSYLSAKEVGGDFYDLFEHKNSIAMVIADTSGKGISACLYSLSIRSMIRSFAQDSLGLSDILQRANRLFCLDSQDSGIFVTLWMGLYDRKTKLLQYASAGHYPAYLKRKDRSVVELQTPSMALGIDPESQFPVQSIPLEKGDFLFLYTDGILDAVSREQEIFGRQRWKNFLLFNEKETAEEWSALIAEELAEFTTGTVQYDDMTLMVIQIR